jgi:signal transduction histidine kinase
VDEVLRELEPTAVESGLAIFADGFPGVPLLFNDRQKTKQILLTLLVNALKFTPAGTVRVRGSFDPVRRRVLIDVKDTGVGIPLEDQPGLFVDFGVPGQSHVGTGAGLGLSIALRLAHLMGGSITLVSAPGKGSTFTLELGNAPPR